MIEEIAMQLFALLAAGFLGLPQVGIGSNANMKSGPSLHPFDPPLTHWEPTHTHVSSVPLVVIPIDLASHFPFVTIRPDDKKDAGGGWQQAIANLPFGRIYPWGYTMWYCDIKIGMPIRHSVKGVISPATAASESARVTNSVARNMDFDLPQGIFCSRFRPAVHEAFKTIYNVGAIAQRP
jgi:hypothetical protein